jgi:Divergent InlB B-repeat domain
MSSRHCITAILGILVLVAVLAVTDASAQLTASWNDNSSGAAAFTIERRLSTDATYTSLADVPTGVTTYVDGTVAQGASYCYRVKAYDAYGTSGYSNEACGSIAAVSVPPPPTTSGYTITITTSGSGTGTITSNPAGISCVSGCTMSYPGGTLVTLTATAASGSRFVGWSGGCSGTAPCTVVGNSALTVGAAFNVLSRGQLKRVQR